MRIRFWGTRGSIASPGPRTVRHGGHTSCVEVAADDGTCLVLDCGTGAHELALALQRRTPRPPVGHLLIGHTHWDHIQGFPFFASLQEAGVEWRVHAPGDRAASLERTFAGQMSPEHHPVALGELAARMRFHALREGVFGVGGIRVRAQYLHHPALTLGYRLEADGAAVVYASDHEPHAVPLAAPPGGDPVHAEDRRHVRFLAGADLVIHDAQYTLAEYPARRGWGHTPVECAVDYALAAGARRLALHHHDPLRDDAAVDALVAAAHARVAAAGGSLTVFAAAEGLEMHLAAAGGRAPAADVGGMPSALLACASDTGIDDAPLLLVTDETSEARDLAATLRSAGLRLLEARDVARAVAEARRDPPALVLLDLAAAQGALGAACTALRSAVAARRRDLPVLVVAPASPSEAELRAAFAAGASDHLSRPIKRALLLSRVRSWLQRG